jgi:hypothetical protein
MMDRKIKAVIPIGREHTVLTLFGYATRGVPGIEIVGGGNSARALKEKLVYFTKRSGVRPPAKRYVLCIEEHETLVGSRAQEGRRWLELPLMVLLWSLAEILPLKDLEHCLCAGRLDVEGGPIGMELPFSFVDQIELTEPQTTWIVAGAMPLARRAIDAREFFKSKAS